MTNPQFTDYYNSKYKHGPLSPIGIPRGQRYLEKFLTSSLWKLIENRENIREMNDNRMDIDEGNTYIFENMETKIIVKITSTKSRSGKTVTWSVEPYDYNYIF